MRRRQLRDALAKVAAFCFVTPLLMVASGLIFGGVLSVVEGWGFVDCFFIVLSELTQMEVHTVEREYYPSTLGGKFFANLVGLWCVIVFATILSVMAGPILLPVLRVIHMVPNEQATVSGGGETTHTVLKPDEDLLATMQPEHLARCDDCASHRRRLRLR